jgi:hypothetical protein
MNYSQPKSTIGFCRLHRWEMSCRQVRVKGCINPRKQCRYGNGQTQQCRYFLKYVDHPFWQRRMARKKRKGGS